MASVSSLYDLFPLFWIGNAPLHSQSHKLPHPPSPTRYLSAGEKKGKKATVTYKNRIRKYHNSPKKNTKLEIKELQRFKIDDDNIPIDRY